MKPTNGHVTPDRRLTIRHVDAEAFAIVHESANVSRDAVVGAPGEWRDRETRFPVHIDEGVVVREFAAVHAGCERPTVIGADSLILSHAYVGHDCVIGTRVEICPGAKVLGLVQIDDGAQIGAGAVVLPRVTIGAGARIGAGAVVRRDVPPGETWAGVPARRIR